MITSRLSDRVVAHLTAVAAEGSAGSARYERREEIGRGGMGTVYRAYDRELDREVALKVLRVAARSSAAERLLREARIIGRLEHPGIVPVHDAGRNDDGRVFYVMKLVQGERLDERVARGLAPDEAFRIFDRVCDAVAFAHAQGIVHRDLKPENVMLGAFGEALVLDWGIAASLGDTESRGMVAGTPGWMAPEQGRGESVDGRTDVFGLGGILEAMTENGRRAGALAAIVARARADRPAERYASVADLAADVRRFALRRKVSAYRESPVERLKRVALRYRAAILLVGVYLLVRLALLLGGI